METSAAYREWGLGPFRGAFTFILGINGAAESVVFDKIGNLCDRIRTCRRIEDRRDAVRDIRDLAKTNKTEVGQQCLQVLLDVVEEYRANVEIFGYALEALHCILRIDQLDYEEVWDHKAEVNFSKVVVSKSENISMLLDLVEDCNFQVCRPAILVLRLLLQNCRKETQEAILASPMGIRRLMHLFKDKQEILSNNGILVLYELTITHKEIQKIVADDHAFDILLTIIKKKGYSEGGIDTLNCINVLQNLLLDNNSNQSSFQLANLIPSLIPFFNFSSTWSQYVKIECVVEMMKLVRCFVSPSNPEELILKCQNQIRKCGLLKLLSAIMSKGDIPSQILIETMYTVAEVVRACYSNQQCLETYIMSSDPFQSTILTILEIIVTKKKPLKLRLASLYCFYNYMYRNQKSDCYITSTLLLSSINQKTAISLLTDSLLHHDDPLSNWCASSAISSALSYTLKPHDLHMQLSMNGGDQMTLLEEVTTVLVQQMADLRFQTKVGLLELLCIWLANCSQCMNQFLRDHNNIMFLIRQLKQSYSDKYGKMSQCLCATLLGILMVCNTGTSRIYGLRSLHQDIELEFGKQAFIDCIKYISSSEFFTKAAEVPHNSATFLEEICFDYNFTDFFQQISQKIFKIYEEK